MSQLTLAAGLTTLGLDLPAAAQSKLLAFRDLLLKWNKTYKLTALRDPQQALSHHLLDSLAILPHVGPGPLLDVGSGGGLPGIPIAIARPDARVVLVDSASKKAAFLAQAAIELPLANVEAVAARVEDYAPGRRFDVVISRAFSDLATFATASARHLAPHGILVAMKGVHPDEELAELPPAFVVTAKPALTVPGLDAARHLIVMQRTSDAEPR